MCSSSPAWCRRAPGSPSCTIWRAWSSGWWRSLVIGYGLALGGAFLPVALIGLVIFGLTLQFADRLAAAERARFAVLLGERIPAWPPGPGRRFRWLFVPRRATLTGRQTWGSVGYGLLRLPVSCIAAIITIGIWAGGLIMLTLPLYGGQLPGGDPPSAAPCCAGRCRRQRRPPSACSC